MIKHFHHNFFPQVIILTLLLCCSSISKAQNHDIDTTDLYGVKQKFENSRSGIMHFTYDDSTDNGHLFHEIELYFIRSNNNDSTHIYLVDSMTNVERGTKSILKYVFYNDTLINHWKSDDINSAYKRYIESIDSDFTYFPKLTNFVWTFRYPPFKDIPLISQHRLNDSIMVCKFYTEPEVNSNYSKSELENTIFFNGETDEIVKNVVEYRVFKNDMIIETDVRTTVFNGLKLYPEKKENIEELIQRKYHELDEITKPIIEEKRKKREESLKGKKEFKLPRRPYEWSFELASGDSLSSEDIDSRILIMDFYYRRCSPCILAMMELRELDSLFQKKDVQIVGFNVKDKDVEKINSQLKKFKINYPIAINAYELSRKYNFSSVPQILVIDTKKNKIIKHYSGLSDYHIQEIKDIVNKRLHTNY